MLSATHTDFAPWTLVDFNDQPLGRLTLLRDLLDRVPDTELPLAEIRVAAARPRAVRGAFRRAPADRDYPVEASTITAHHHKRSSHRPRGRRTRTGDRDMRAGKLLIQITVYYLLIAPRGVRRAEALARAARLSAGRRGRAADHASRPRTRWRRARRCAPRMSPTSGRASSGWSSRSSRAILVSLPVSWVYMAVRGGEEYDQSLVNTIIVLPMVVTGIVIIVQNSPRSRVRAGRHCGSGAVPKLAQELGRRVVHPAVGGDRSVRRYRRDRARRGHQHRLQLLLRRCCGSPNMASAQGMKRFLTDYDGSDQTQRRRSSWSRRRRAS